MKAVDQRVVGTTASCWQDTSLFRFSLSGVISSLLVSTIFFWISAYNDFPASNQNNNALHASVLSGFTPGLAEDWLYKTTDPFPSATIITALFLKFGPGGIYCLYYLVIVAFVLAFVTFLDSHNDAPSKDAFTRSLWSGLIVLGALVFGRLTGLSAGVAGQLILSSMWQPSEAGVLLVISILLFAAHWNLSSALFAALAVTLHPSLAFGALIVVTACCLSLVAEREWRESFIFGGIFTLAVLPAATYAAIQFTPTSDGLSLTASHILAREKIPFHSIPAEWLASSDILKLSMIGFAGYIMIRQNIRLFHVIIISLILGIFATGLFVYLDDDRLFLLFPWRVSVVLAPIACVFFVSILANGMPSTIKAQIYNLRTMVSTFSIIGILALSIQVMKLWVEYPGFVPKYWIKNLINDEAYDVRVRDRRERLEVIRWAKTRKDADVYLVPLDFEQFRMKSGRPTFVDWKSHPYKDTEIIEWWRRINIAKKAYEDLRECRPIESKEFNVVILDDSSFSFRLKPNCILYQRQPVTSRFSFVKLR